MIEVAGDRLRVTGPMVITSVSALKGTGESAIANGAMVIDLAGVTDADSAAVALLLAWVRTAQAAGTGLSIVDAPDSIRSLATLYGVAELLPLA